MATPATIRYRAMADRMEAATPMGMARRLFLTSSPTSVAASMPKKRPISRGVAARTPPQPSLMKGVKAAGLIEGAPHRAKTTNRRIRAPISRVCTRAARATPTRFSPKTRAKTASMVGLVGTGTIIDT
ncbi:hypothetical protein D3C73_1298640 [compost metagenome]